MPIDTADTNLQRRVSITGPDTPAREFQLELLEQGDPTPIPTGFTRGDIYVTDPGTAEADRELVVLLDSATSVTASLTYGADITRKILGPVDPADLTQSQVYRFTETATTFGLALGAANDGAPFFLQFGNGSGGSVSASVSGAWDGSGTLDITLNAAPGAGETQDVYLLIFLAPPSVVTITP